MKRRRLLTLVILGIGFPGGYLAWSHYQRPDLPDGMSIETRYLKQDVLRSGSLRETDHLGWKDEFHTVIEDSNRAQKHLDTGFVGDFVEATDFNSSYLLLVQNGMQSQPDLVLDSINRTEDGLQIDISIDAPRSGADDLGPHSLLFRITDRNGGVPESVTVDIGGYP